MILSCSRLLRSLLSLLFGRQLSLWLLRKKHTLKADQNKECSFFHGPMLTGRRGFVEPANCLSQTLNEIFDLLVSEEVEELGLIMMERKSVMRWSVRRRRRDWSNSVIGIGAVGATDQSSPSLRTSDRRRHRPVNRLRDISSQGFLKSCVREASVPGTATMELTLHEDNLAHRQRGWR